MIQLFLLGSDAAILALRVVLGIVILAHGIPKVKNLKATQGWFDSIGFKPGKLWGTIAAIFEVIGGALLIVGFLTQPVALVLIAEFLVIIGWRLKTKQKLVGGYEIDLVILAGLLALLTLGSDFYSIDGFLGWVLF